MADGLPRLAVSLYQTRNGHDQVDPQDLLNRDWLPALNRRTERERIASESMRQSAGTRSGTGEIQMLRVTFLSDAQEPSESFETGERWTACVRFAVHQHVQCVRFGLALFREKDFVYVYGPNTLFDGLTIPELTPGLGEIRLTIDRLWLLNGAYRVSVVWWRDDPEALQQDDYHPSLPPYDCHAGAYRFQVHSTVQASGIGYFPHVPLVNAKNPPEMSATQQIITGQPITLRWRRDPDVLCQEPAQLQLVRDDGLECFGVQCSHDLQISECNLLPGRYWVRVNQRVLQELVVVSHRRDHGCIYLPHQWMLNFSGQGIAEPPPLEAMNPRTERVDVGAEPSTVPAGGVRE